MMGGLENSFEFPLKPDDELAPCSWMLELEKRANQAYQLKATDFIPLVGSAFYSARTDDTENGTSIECPTHSSWKEAKGAAVLIAYNMALAAGLWYLLK